MSRIINGENSEECKPWQAPDLDNTGSNDNSYDFKIAGSENIMDRQQQEIIYQQSYEKSYAKGYMEGLSQGKRELREQFENLQSLMAALAVPLPNVDDQVVAELVKLCIAIVKQMVRRELNTSPEDVIAVVKEAVTLLPVAVTEVTLELHPDDAKLIKNTLIQSGVEPDWKIVADPLLTRGGCRVLTSTSRIDATVEKRINSVISNVMGCASEADHV